MNKPNFSISILIFLIFGGCYTVSQNVSTTYRKPEVNINSVDREKVKSAIINYYLDSDNYSLVSESDNIIVFSTPEEEIGDAVYQALTGDYNSTMRINIRINMASIENATRVVSFANSIIKKDNGREEVKDITNDWSDLLLKELQLIKSLVEAQ
jgi:hypothetical protein